MNTTIEAVLYTSKTLSNGQHPIMLRLTKNRKRKYISLHISLALQYWDAEKCKPRRNCPDKERIEALIQQKTQELQSQVMDFKTSDKEYTLNTLVEKASRKVVRQTGASPLYPFHSFKRTERSGLCLRCRNNDSGRIKTGFIDNN